MQRLKHLFVLPLLILGLLIHGCEQKSSEEGDKPQKQEEEGQTAPNNMNERTPTLDPINKDKSPLEVAQVVADRVVEVTPFEFRLIQRPIDETFDFLKFVDFGRTYDQEEAGIAYAKTQIRSEKDTLVTLMVSHTDAAKIWVNGKEVYKKSGKRPALLVPQERDLRLEYPVKVNLKQGKNEVLVKSAVSGQQSKWLFYIQPQGALTYASPVKGLELGLSEMENVSEEVSTLSNWLIIGPFQGNEADLGKVFPPEENFEIGSIYGQDHSITWSIPKVELFADVIGAHPNFGTYYSFNYHAAGVAWAMAHLGRMCEEPNYIEFSHNYTDFILEKRPYLKFQVEELKGYRGIYHNLFDTPLLDFTTAPALPFTDRVIHDKDYPTQKETQQYVDRIIDYALHEQVRLEDGTFTRETPKKYTTWVDDMFMGIPFLVHASRAASKPATKKALVDEAYQQVIGFHEQVWDKEAQLYHHAQYANRQADMAHWSRANGWGIWAASEVLKYLPEDHPKRDAVMEIYTKHVKNLAKHQDETGFWRNILDMENSPLETSGTAIFTLAIARGINEGWISEEEYKPIVLASWDALLSQIEKDGQVHNIIMGTMCSENPEYYNNRPFVDNDSHGLLGLLFACMEMEKLMKEG